MASSLKFTLELSDVFKYINDILLAEMPAVTITPEYFLAAVLSQEDCVAYRCISNIVMSDDIKTMKEKVFDHLVTSSRQPIINTKPKYDPSYTTAAVESENEAKRIGTTIMNSGIMLCAWIKVNEEISRLFSNAGTDFAEMFDQVGAVSASMQEIMPSETEQPTTTLAVKHVKPQKDTALQQQPKKNTMITKSNAVALDKNLINLTQLSEEGRIRRVVLNDDVYDRLFTLLSKKDNNNVMLLGKSGVGKTATALNIANLVNSNDVPRPFRGKTVAQLDYVTLSAGNIFKGSLEGKFKPMVESLAKRGNCILVIDDLPSVMENRSGEADMQSLMNMVLDNKAIPLVCTATDKDYRNMLSDYPQMKRKLETITIEEHDEDENVRILETIKDGYENFHNVSYGDGVLRECVRLCRRYVGDKCLPDSAICVLDDTGAAVSITNSANGSIEALEDELARVLDEKRKVKNGTDSKDYDRVDELTKEEISIKSRIKLAEKESELEASPHEVSVGDIKRCVSLRTGVPLDEIGESDREKLRDMDSFLKESVIGQDEAVDAVCRVVKRQRIGMSDPVKPSVFMFVGSSGTGKTLLAKKLAEKVFGSEKYLVRLDMSEYSDKISTNKLIGSAHGYVGYEEGGILTNAIKKNKHCVLLLDEIEKADDSVYNMFLQTFDEGRMTDNRGETVDFSNVIVIMTSNVGVKDAAMRGRAIGFATDGETFTNDIITKSMKKKFSPEFLNRIDRIVFFNKLGEEQLKRIIANELSKLDGKLRDIGYSLDGGFFEKKFIDHIYSSIEGDAEYGARPIIREVQRSVEDAITDLIIGGDRPVGYAFTVDDIVTDRQ